MKSFRFLALLVALPISMTMAVAQDPGLGRKKPPANPGGGGGSTPPSRPSGPPPNSGGDAGGRQRSEPGPRPSSPPSPNRDGGLGRDRDRPSSPPSSGPTSDPSRGAPNAPSGSRDRDRPTSGSRDQGNRSGSRDQGLGRDQGIGRGPTPNPGTPGSSRSGPVRYGTSNNALRQQPAVSPNQYNSPSTGGRLPNQVFRRDQPFAIDNGWRYGYYHYNRNWRDDNFYYGFYSFAPNAFQSVCVSPWYVYPFLPAYLNPTRAIFIQSYATPWNWYDGTVINFQFNSNSRWDDDRGWGTDRFQRQDVRNAIDDLTDGFERRDRRALNRLIPRRGDVAIFKDGRYDYSVNSDDFYDLLNDLSSNADTNRYEVVEVRYLRNSVRLSTRHSYIDPWGNRQDVYHQIYMESERSGYVIKEFGTSSRRVW